MQESWQARLCTSFFNFHAPVKREQELHGHCHSASENSHQNLNQFRVDESLRSNASESCNSHQLSSSCDRDFLALKSIVSEKYEEKFLNMISSCLKNSSLQNKITLGILKYSYLNRKTWPNSFLKSVLQYVYCNVKIIYDTDYI